jgi:hypothetical protein
VHEGQGIKGRAAHGRARPYLCLCIRNLSYEPERKNLSQEEKTELRSGEERERRSGCGGGLEVRGGQIEDVVKSDQRGDDTDEVHGAAN